MEGDLLFRCGIGATLATDFASANDVAWMSDSQHWLEFESNPDILKRRKPGQIILTGRLYEAAFMRQIGTTEVERILALMPPILRLETFRLAQNKIIVTTGSNQSLDFYEYTLGATAEARLHQISKHPNASEISFVSHPALSPKGDRIAWIVKYEPRNQKLARGVWIHSMISKKLQEIDTFRPIEEQWPKLAVESRWQMSQFLLQRHDLDGQCPCSLALPNC